MVNSRHRGISMFQTMGIPDAPRGVEPAVSNTQAKLRRGSAMFGALAIGLLLFAHSPAQAVDNVRIGVGIDPSFTTWWIAKDAPARCPAAVTNCLALASVPPR